MSEQQPGRDGKAHLQVSRRQLLGAIGVGALAGTAPTLARPLTGHGAIHDVARASTAATPAVPRAASLHGDGILVLCTLYGGNDGLDTVVPAADPAYQAARTALAWRTDQVLALRDGFGLNPAMKSLHGLYQQGRVAIIHGVGYPSPNRSHFRSMDIWQSAVPDSHEMSGWLGRWLDLVGTDPLKMVHTGASVPLALTGRKGSASALPGGQISIPAALAPGLALEAAGGGENGPLAARVAASYADLLRLRSSYGPILASSKAAAAGTSLEGGATATGDSRSELDDQLDVVAALIAAGTPARVFSVSLGGFDTHAQERDQHTRLLSALDAALGRFQARLATIARGTGVVTLVHSEFGRRVSPNLSAGTDHGTAGPVFVLGEAVKGAMFGAPPSLTDLDQGDLKFTTDFRSIYAAVLGSVLGTDAGAVIPKCPPALAGLL